MIGTGWADKAQIPAFKAAGLAVVGIAGRSAERTERVAVKHGIPFHTTAWEDLFELDFDLVSITTPPHLHKEMVLAAVREGRHLLCEKPLALSRLEAQEMVSAAGERSDLLHLVDHQLRFLPARSKAFELLQSGAIGRIVTVTGRFHSNMRLDPETQWNWWSDLKRGGGILGAIGSHVLDGIRWLLAAVTGDVEVRGATLGRVHPMRRDVGGVMREVTADDIASVTFRMGDAVGTMLVHGAAGDAPVDLLTVRGTEGTLILDRSLKLYLGRGGGALKEYVTHLPGIVPNRFRSSPFAAGTVLFAQALADALESGDAAPLAPAASLEDGAAVQRLLDEVRHLAATKTA